ncbi:glycoside hydrolase family 3 N-terminal domain-containing protein [Planococcus liqunii]|uniref:glycoside hydrolase family 3 protein n=1 Tax=Planococcus liqunii TaxID=3058394 RepID=UPI002635BEA1|nr:glycoside hydrolase family 3 protein [Planococcus sp. N056]WKA51632.1 glycoside hydrolase family 3 N-terminal domain-containing protein [Planococcus sp. N056]
MKKIHKLLVLPLVIAALVVSSLAAGAGAAKAQNSAADLVILQNVPEVEVDSNGELTLKAVHLYEDGHFLGASEGLEWSSTNKTVASVDAEGTVTVLGKPGKTFITVTDGSYTDRIAVQVKPDGSAKTGKGKPPVKVSVIKSGGERYNLIEKAVAGMTMEEKVGQMLMPDFRNWKGQNVTQLLPEIEQLVKQYHLGGVILFRENVVTTEQTTKLVADYQEAAEKYGLLMTIDQEGGIVTRLQSGTDMPGSMALGATRSAEITENVGNAIGEELSALGINMNFAPSFDINNNPDNPVIGVRSFGENPELVAELGVAYTKGLQASGTAATAKHFPGHGDTATDSHIGLPEVPYDLERLKAVELYPFQKAMEAGIDAIMTAHVTFPKVDGTKVISKKDGSEITLPATLSHKVLTELMRDEMGYEGVIFTDALNMQAIADHFGPVEAVIRAVNAGSDIVLMPVGLESVANGLYEAVRSGEISEDRIESSAKRILALKLKRGIVKEETPKPVEEKVANALQVVGSEEHQQVEREASEKSITLVKNEGVLPLAPNPEDLVVVVGNAYSDELYAGLKARHGNTIWIQKDNLLTEQELAQVQAAKAVVVGTRTSTVSQRSPNSGQMKMANQIIASTDAPVIAVGIQNPYDIMAYPEVDAYLTQYSFRTASYEAMASTILGQLSPTGKLPVTIPDLAGGTLYEYGHGLTY